MPNRRKNKRIRKRKEESLMQLLSLRDKEWKLYKNLKNKNNVRENKEKQNKKE